ncbi:serine hydrolase [Spirosoma sp. HMF4905]|uniref:Serine hydrolase n=1 Tax=Spirosoma arboris TaxID=2682092 RepID=A0A7K1SAZ6_9BACT|nr:serine hydrolase [Spirosoma arboris]MVM30951.1 serine hydrolase [Spirosoma arboris]
MNKWLLINLLGLASLTAQAQVSSYRSYSKLKEFQGLYQYQNHTTLKLAASPRDSLLYAIIAESRYPLYPIGPDLFRNQSKDTIAFQRNPQGKVIAYSVKHQQFLQLSDTLSFPIQMWYPRLGPPGQSLVYTYHPPSPNEDGLMVGNLRQSGLDAALLTTMVDKIIKGIYPNIHSVLIIKDGRLVFEEYFYEYNQQRLHQLRSATKSFISALTGIAIDQGYITSVNAPVLPFFPEYQVANNSPAKQAITIAHLLANQSGLDCDVANEHSIGNETQMDYSADWVKYTLDLPMSDVPGGKGMYCSGNPITVGRIIEKQTHQSLPKFATQRLFTPLGITQFDWHFQPDSSSAETYCQLSLRPRDMAKFGLLYLNKGVWQGKQLLSQDWVTASFTKHSVVQNVNYGYLWWLKYLNANGTRFEGMAAQGNGGQRIYIWPTLHMVTVITGGNFNQQSPADELLANYILKAFTNQR